jgi:hypothetical protein
MKIDKENAKKGRERKEEKERKGNKIKERKMVFIFLFRT